MKSIGIAFSTKDRTELTGHSLLPLLGLREVDIHWYDGSQTEAGQELFREWNTEVGGEIAKKIELTGGSCRYIVRALTDLINAGYQYIGLVENDVRLHDDWYQATFDLLSRGRLDGLKVGAISARCYEDRILIQRDGYSVNHNLGAGMVIFTREAAEIVLQHYRTHMTGENRRTFSALSNIDIGRYWAFRGSEHMLVADWGYDRQLAEHGLSSLALTPAKAEQMEDIEAMGLKMAAGSVESLINDEAFETYRARMAAIRKGDLWIPRAAGGRLFVDGMHVIFPHQVASLGGFYKGDWRFKWSLGFGCFAWRAGEQKLDDDGELASVTVPVLGPCDLLVSGGKDGGKVKVEDAGSGFQCEPELMPEGEQGNVLQVAVPSVYSYRTVKLTALTPGITFYGLRTREEQPCDPNARFDFSVLPPL